MTNLETIRRRRGLLQQELAERADVPQATISRAESGKGVVVASALKIARALGASVEEAFGDAVLDPNEVKDDAEDEGRDPTPSTTDAPPAEVTEASGEHPLAPPAATGTEGR